MEPTAPFLLCLSSALLAFIVTAPSLSFLDLVQLFIWRMLVSLSLPRSLLNSLGRKSWFSLDCFQRHNIDVSFLNFCYKFVANKWIHLYIKHKHSLNKSMKTRKMKYFLWSNDETDYQTWLYLSNCTYMTSSLPPTPISLFGFMWFQLPSLPVRRQMILFLSVVTMSIVA